MKPILHFLVNHPEHGVLTWIGGGLRRSKKKGFVILTKLDGEPVLEIERERVKPSSAKETAKRLAQDHEYQTATQSSPRPTPAP